MPHHSGGGSHSGGSHSSHHSSSHSSRSSGPYISKKPFYNSRRFRYYDRNGREHYVYSTEMPKKQSLFELIFIIVFFIPFLVVGALSCIPFMPVKALKPVYEAPDLHIEDHIGAIDNYSDLENVLKDFEELTGISPYIITVYDHEWENNYVDLVDYSYDLYVNHFEDEQHFLIVYSEPENADELSFVDWRWEAMQGDETDPIITEANFERFQSDLQEGLTRNSTPTGDAMEDAFTNSLDYMMKMDKNNLMANLAFPLLWNFIVIFSLVAFVKNFIASNRKYEEVPMDNAAGYSTGSSFGTNMSGYNTGSSFGTNMTGYNTGSSFGTNMTGYNTGSSFGTNMTGYNTGSNFGTDMTNYNTGNNYSTNAAGYQNDDLKYNQDNVKTGGGYVLNGEYYDPSQKKD